MFSSSRVLADLMIVTLGMLDAAQAGGQAPPGAGGRAGAASLRVARVLNRGDAP